MTDWATLALLYFIILETVHILPYRATLTVQGHPVSFAYCVIKRRDFSLFVETQTLHCASKFCAASSVFPLIFLCESGLYRYCSSPPPNTQLSRYYTFISCFLESPFFHLTSSIHCYSIIVKIWL